MTEILGKKHYYCEVSISGETKVWRSSLVEPEQDGLRVDLDFQVLLSHSDLASNTAVKIEVLTKLV